ncbi:MAG TPA: fatty acid desaturase, partial [Taishania sp.]|nr:fatty acid desaturase [Taishania sp.]
MVALYIVPYILILTVAGSAWLALLLWAITGLGMAGVGLSVMHDGNHGAYSKYKFVNRLMGYMANLVGGSDLNWRIQHNVLHHTYTNVHDLDDDL